MSKHFRLALWLAVFTILYNAVEGIISVYFGMHDETLTLLGFGIDSFIEFISGFGILSMVIRIHRNGEDNRSAFEKTALKITGVSFYILAAGLIVSDIINLLNHSKPSTTLPGVIISGISIIVMLVLVSLKTKTGKALNSEAILADAACTKVCIYMSVALLISSGLYELIGWGGFDTIGALALAVFSYREGKECFEKAKNNSHCGCHS